MPSGLNFGATWGCIFSPLGTHLMYIGDICVDPCWACLGSVLGSFGTVRLTTWGDSGLASGICLVCFVGPFLDRSSVGVDPSGLQN